MVIEYIRYKVQPENREAFTGAYEKASKQLDDSGYCLAYELAECEEEPGSYILRIEWTSTDQHLNGFRKSELFPAFFGNVKPFFDAIQEMRHYNPTAISKRK